VYLGAEAKEVPGSRDRRVPNTITWFDEVALSV
jgi:hypothetical protein